MSLSPDVIANAPEVPTTTSTVDENIPSPLAGASPAPSAPPVDPLAGQPTMSTVQGSNGPTQVDTSKADFNQDPSVPSVDPKRPWKSVLTATLAVLSGAAPGFGQKTFSGGVSAGAKSVLAQQQQKKENDDQAQRMAMEQQRSMDEHQTAQSNLATAHITQQTLAAQYDLMPKSTQDLIDRQSMAAGETAKEQPGSKVVGTFATFQEAQAQQSAFMKANPDSALNTQLFHNAKGGFDVISVPSPDKLNDKPVDVTVGYDVKSGTPIKRTYAAGTISYAQRQNMETTATQNAVNANNSLEEYKKKSAIEVQAAGQKAYLEQQGKNKADNEDASSQPGAGLTGDEYLNTLKPADKSVVNAVYEGRMELSNRVLASKQGQHIAQMVNQAHPDWDQSRAAAYFAARKGFVAGKEAQGINHLNTAIQHIGKLYQATTFSATAPIVSGVARAFGGDNAKAFQYYKQKVGEEIESAYKSGALTDMDKKEADKEFNEWLPSNARKGEKALTTLLVGKLHAYDQQWENAKPSAAINNFPVVSQDNVAIIKRVTGEDVSNLTAQSSRTTQPITHTGTVPVGAQPILREGKTVGFVQNGKRTDF